ncbi:hypothetical protein [Methanoregula sp.]|jgi:hypothetical protein|uniref:hypothetical protein n=1 Tax=Methanoregula sp. TaxID=2052170 RepID=UPI003C769F5B
MYVAVAFLLVCLCACLVVTPVAAYGYSTNFEGYLGDTIDLSGPSYNSQEVYLFLTGPGLPDDGVTLTDTSKRADQGQFTMVDVNSDQMWSMKWDTSRIEDNIDPGTYTVYVVNAPVDKSNLAGHSYDTISVYLKDTGTRHQGSVSVGSSYTLHPGGLTDDTVVPTTVITTAPPTSPPTTIIPETAPTTLPTTVITSTPTQKSASLPWAALLCVAGIGLIRVFSRKD